MLLNGRHFLRMMVVIYCCQVRHRPRPCPRTTSFRLLVLGFFFSLRFASRRWITLCSSKCSMHSPTPRPARTPMRQSVPTALASFDDDYNVGTGCSPLLPVSHSLNQSINHSLCCTSCWDMERSRWRGPGRRELGLASEPLEHKCPVLHHCSSSSHRMARRGATIPRERREKRRNPKVLRTRPGSLLVGARRVAAPDSTRHDLSESQTG